jgi:diguanylate cyclase (GGDEF)-like protein/PAS domain S-box-containing protein
MTLPASRAPLPDVSPEPDLLGLLERATGAGTWAMDVATRRMTWTQPLLRLLGVPPGQAPARQDPQHFYAIEFHDVMVAALAACEQAGEPFDEEVQIITARGARLWVRSLGEPVRDAAGAVVGIQGALQDLTVKKQAERESQRLAMRLSTTLASITDAFATLDQGGRFTFVNRESERLLRRASADLLGRTLWQELDVNGRGRLRRELQMALRNSRNVEFEEFCAPLGLWIEMRAYPFEDGLAVYFRDITARKAADDEIEHLAFYDTLTQLPNRQLLMDRLQAALSDDTRTTGVGALMFIDLDHFKVLNDTQGHAKGDLLLQLVAARLSCNMRHGDTVARLGGDEFVVLLQDVGENYPDAQARAQVVGNKLLAAVSEPAELGGYLHHGTCSIGIALFGNADQTLGDILKQTDLAMYRAKAEGRNAACFYDPQMQAAATAHATLVSRLRTALVNQEFVLHYQPQVGPKGQMVGVEALMRWHSPHGGLVMPQDFIGQAEESGLILPMGQWALRSACAQLVQWAACPATARFSIAVNVSARQFRHPEFVDGVMAAIAGSGIDASRLKLELTESLLATDMDVTISKMGQLKDAGVTLSIDDFGMGYSGLSYLKYLPLDQIKIDRSFVKDVLTDRNDAAIVRTIIGLAQGLDLGVMAEGVETEGQRQFLAEHGCNCYQGYLFCKPLPIDELDRFIRAL